jgi:hypothetical protein
MEQRAGFLGIRGHQGAPFGALKAMSDIATDVPVTGHADALLGDADLLTVCK